MSKMLILATLLIGFNVNAMMILPTHPEVTCVGLQQYADSGLTVNVAYVPTQQSYILHIDRVTFAGKQTVREEARRFETKMPNTPVIYASENYSLTVGTSINPQVGYAAVLKHGPSNQSITVSCRPVRSNN